MKIIMKVPGEKGSIIKLVQARIVMSKQYTKIINLINKIDEKVDKEEKPYVIERTKKSMQQMYECIRNEDKQTYDKILYDELMKGLLYLSRKYNFDDIVKDYVDIYAGFKDLIK